MPSPFDHFQFALIHGPNNSGSFLILLFTALDLASIHSPIHNWVLFMLWFHPFLLSGVISLLISNSILGSYQSGEFLFQCPIILSFHIDHLYYYHVVKDQLSHPGLLRLPVFQRSSSLAVDWLLGDYI